jgi:hypothetical protein
MLAPLLILALVLPATINAFFLKSHVDWHITWSSGYRIWEQNSKEAVRVCFTYRSLHSIRSLIGSKKINAARVKEWKLHLYHGWSWWSHKTDLLLHNRAFEQDGAGCWRTNVVVPDTVPFGSEYRLMLERPGWWIFKVWSHSPLFEILTPLKVKTELQYARYPSDSNDESTPLLGSRQAPFPPSGRKTSMVFVNGLGCEPEESRDPNVYIECDTNVMRAMWDIVKNTCWRTSTGSNFVQHVFNRVNTELEKGHSVALVGMSYGGSVASRVAKLLVNHPLKSRVRITTCGSIEITHPRELPGIAIQHIMALNDVSLKCNRLDPKRDTFVTWLDPYDGAPVPTPIYSFLGSVEEWTIHQLAYDKCIDNGMRPF